MQNSHFKKTNVDQGDGEIYSGYLDLSIFNVNFNVNFPLICIMIYQKLTYIF